METKNIDPEMSNDDCLPEPECCPLCGYEYSEDDDGGICWDCDMEMFAVFTGLI